uniref:PHF7/G2E3-like PHD zinc finger domain-containing protein n=1 Tax=Periophthalmus magnuspinnatus TaxID=409849 RepID=A0A3B4AIV5_9GOBI
MKKLKPKPKVPEESKRFFKKLIKQFCVCCALCGSCDDDPVILGDKVKVPELKRSVHYFCLSWSNFGLLQRQAHSSGLFFFRCTLCNNKDQFQEEMLRLGIHIPERDASWELETGAYSELLEVYRHCDAETCEFQSWSCFRYLEIIRCRLCGSRGTHRKCSGLRLETRDWASSSTSPKTSP